MKTENPFVLNSPENSEVVLIRLDEIQHPTAFSNAVKSLVNSGMSEEEAKNYVRTTPYEMEVLYDVNSGLFAVESEAIGSTPIYHPYSGEETAIAYDDYVGAENEWDFFEDYGV